MNLTIFSSCWAFSAVATLESQVYQTTGRQSAGLSEQQLVDCATGGSYYNLGCSGGYPWNAMDYIKNNGGITTETFYPVFMFKLLFTRIF